MDPVLIAVRVALTFVFAFAAVAKLLDMAGSRRALEGFGVPAPLVPPAAAALPGLELTAATLLAMALTARAGATLALILLVVLIPAIVLALGRGVAPDCHCIGQLHSEPAGWVTAARSAVLAIAAAFVLGFGPGPGIPWWLAHTDGTIVALVFVSLLTIVLVWTGFSLWQRNRLLAGRGRASQIPVALEVGQSVPEVHLETGDGSNLPATELVDDDRRAIFVFTNAGCEPSVELLPELARWRKVLQARLDIRVLAAGDGQENRRLAAEHGIPLLLDRDGAAVRAFGVEATPSAVEVDALGRVASRTAIGAPAIEGLIRAALERPTQSPGLELHHVKGGVGSTTAAAAG